MYTLGRVEKMEGRSILDGRRGEDAHGARRGRGARAGRR